MVLLVLVIVIANIFQCSNGDGGILEIIFDDFCPFWMILEEGSGGIRIGILGVHLECRGFWLLLDKDSG